MPMHQHQLKVSEERFRLLVACVKDYAIFMLDTRGYIASWNVGAERIKGYLAEEIIGKHFSVFYPRAEVETGKCDHELEVAAREGRFEDEGWRIRKDGTRFWANVVITAIRDDSGTLIGYGKVTRDLTARLEGERERLERLRAQEETLRRALELRESEERFRLFVESVEDYAILMLDPKGHVSSWNAGAERIKGYAAQEIIGRHFSTFYPREDVEAGKCEHELEVAAREGRFEDEGWRVRKDGTMFWANVVITAVRDASGTLVGYGKVTRDLTSRIHAEQERIRLARAEEGERRKEDCLAILGHELRNPLAPIVTAVHLIKLRRGLKCEKEIAVLERQVTHMMRLLDDLLDVSRMTRGKVQISPEVIDLGEVLANAVDGASPLIEQKKHRLRLDVPTGQLLVNVDAERMAQVFVNLLNNAAKYTDAGGEIRVRAVGDDDEVDVTIEDTGMGIAPEVLPQVFELFTQGAQTMDRQLGGLGIGLAVARRLVREHGGEISAESKGLGQGSRFTVRLPRSVGTTARVSERPERSSSPLRQAVCRRVLIVDDNHDSNELMRMFLEELGHEVHIAFDGPHGLELAHQIKPDIAFLDLGLPGMDGFELARRMRQIPACATIPLVAVSGYATARDRAATKSAGFTAHVAKPFDPTSLEDVVNQARLDA
jgi:PAS domain S-box-containing protein